MKRVLVDLPLATFTFAVRCFEGSVRCLGPDEWVLAVVPAGDDAAGFPHQG